MMSYAVSAAWSHPVSSTCYIEHGQRCGAVLSGRITTIAMPMSDQLGLRGLQGAGRGPQAHLGRGCEPAGGANFLVPRSVILIFLLGSRRRAHHQRENIDDGPPGGVGVEGLGVPTINMKTLTMGPREVPELKVRERPPLT
jgi:hypothetical protein